MTEGEEAEGRARVERTEGGNEGRRGRTTGGGNGWRKAGPREETGEGRGY